MLYRESCSGVRGNNNDQKMDQFHFLPDDAEKALAPLVLVHLREMQNFEEKALTQISSEIFVIFINLTMGTNEKLSFLRHLMADD